MSDIERARDFLKAEGLTCVLCKGDVVHKSNLAGIRPMMGFLRERVDLAGFAAADRVIGKAAAFLFLAAGVSEVYGEVMSAAAVELLKKHEIKFTFHKLVDIIERKDGHGMCPMETAVADIENVKEAVQILKDKISAGVVKKLGFGLMRMPLLDPNEPGSFDFDTVNKMIDRFVEQGFTYFDTAYVYHGGAAEAMFKRCVAERFPREKYTVATKLPMGLVKSYEDQEKLFAEQLKNCGVEYFDYYLLHALNSRNIGTVKACDSFDFGFKKKAEGKIRNFGFSFHDTPELLDELLSEHPNVDFVQLQINYLDWENHSIQSRKCLEVARKHKVPVVVMEPVKGGQLVSVPEGAEKFLKGVNPDLSIPSWAIRFAASQEGVMMVLSGMSTLEQLEDNTSYMKNFAPLNAKEREAIDTVRKIMDGSFAIGCTGCAYCVKGCPKNIAIPNYFALYNDYKRTPTHIAPIYYQNLSTNRGRASECIKCGQCEAVCPQKLKIIDNLASVAEVFEAE